MYIYICIPYHLYVASAMTIGLYMIPIATEEATPFVWLDPVKWVSYREGELHLRTINDILW